MYKQPDALKLTTPLGADALLLERFEGREAISEPFRFRLEMLAEAGTDIPFERILGAEVSVALGRPDGMTRTFHGIIHRFTEGEQEVGPRGETTFTRYEAEMVPRLFLLGRKVQSRVFASKTIPEILAEVLSGLDVVDRIQGQWEPREFVAQYRETDLAFASRLMEEEGIFYFFRHSTEGHQLILANTPQAHPEVDRPSKVIYEKVIGGTRDEERVLAWRKTQEIRSGRSTLRDYCFAMPGKDLTASRTIQETADVGAVTHSLQVGGNAAFEIYDDPGRFAQRFDDISPGGQDQPQALGKIFDDGLRTVGIRMQEEAAAGLVVDGEGGCRQFAAGHSFSLQRHRNGDGPYILASVEHEASVEGTYTRDEPARLSYRNRFRALPASIPFRPARVTPMPRAHGPQTAVVVGPSADDPIFCDKYGRIKVQFLWDRAGSKDADSSCWIRVSQPWAGSNWGAITLPRVGQEVVVDFLGGDPDRPMIVGSVYNAAQMPPFTLPANKTQAGFKSHSHRSDSGEAFSGLGFEDADGGEHVHLHSQRHMTQSTEQNFYINAANQHHQHVGKYSVRQVGGLPFMDHSATMGAGGGGGGPGGRRGAGNNDKDPDVPNTATNGPFYWNPAVEGGIAENLDMVLGWRRCNTVGLYSTTTFGQTNATTINPLGLIRFLEKEPIDPGFRGAAGLGLASVLKSATIGVAIGGTTSMHYGPKIDIRHGSAAVEATRKNDTVCSLASGVLASMYCVSALGDLLLPLIPNSSSVGAATGYGIGAITLTDLLLASWIALETRISKTESLGRKLKMIADSFNVRNAEVKEQLDGSAEDERLASSDDEGERSSGVADVDTSGMVTKSSDSLYAINSPRISLLSSLGLDATEPSLIAIQALGNELTQGTVLVQGTSEVIAIGGDQTYFSMETIEDVEGAVLLDCGPAGTITLQSGIEQEPNSLIMSPEGIAASSTLRIEAEVDECSITMTPEGITETAAESALSITAEGITLTVAESVVEITAEGIILTSGPCSVEITPEGIMINGLTIALTGDESVEITAPETMIL
ncbi:type VI secretion system Vgr family protein [Tundrisphaera sp. TA3]|uniref:type VI secretion system Vgr family protein n=1 Tax=Tundrisphaera sp. TA3 TaxID=3435775 RepID=UPI003EBC0222